MSRVPVEVGPGTWAAPAARGPVHGTVRVPGSKSLTNRHLLLAALADDVSTLRRPLVSRDALLMVGALERLGVRVDRSTDDVTWTITPPERLTGGTSIDCGLAGTVLRFVPPVAALAHGQVAFHGDEGARTRPIAPLLQGLRDLGVEVRHDGAGGFLPFTVQGTGAVRGGQVEIDAATSSQFVSALLLAGARFAHGLTLVHTGDRLPSAPHVAMTLQTLRTVGVQVTVSGRHTWQVAPGPVRGVEVTVEPDLSSAAPFLALAAVTGGQVTVPDWPRATTQAGDRMREILRAMGARDAWGEDGLTLTGPAGGRVHGVDLDLHDVGELTPVVAAVAALATSPSRLRGVAHLRGHETDRLAALETELGRLGCKVAQTPDGLTITPAPLRPAVLQTYHDHRMAMAAAVLGAAVPGTGVRDVETTAKTYPGFAAAWSGLVG